jgi:hypothetical protein
VRPHDRVEHCLCGGPWLVDTGSTAGHCQGRAGRWVAGRDGLAQWRSGGLRPPLQRLAKHVATRRHGRGVAAVLSPTAGHADAVEPPCEGP